MADTSKHQNFFVFGDKHFRQEHQPKFLADRVETFYQKRVRETWHNRHIMRGLTPKPTDIILQSNDYLCIAQHEHIVKAQVASLLQKGQGQMRSAIFSFGEGDSQANFEKCMAKFLNVEDVLTTQSGWCANTGLIQSIAKPGTPVYIDTIAHMSLWEGISSANANPIPFAHNNMRTLRRKIAKHGPGVIVVDSVYSTLGDIAPLVELVDIKKETGCLLIVDESHSLGLYGQQGRGLVNQCGLVKDVDFITSSLSKAFSGRGGIITCTTRSKEYLIFESLPAIFSTSVLPHDVAGFKATIDVIEKEDWRRMRLHYNADYLRQALLALGYNLQGSCSQIISLCPGDEQLTIDFRDYLEKRGIFGSIYCYPATSKNRALIRFSITSNLNKKQLDYIISVCKEAREPMRMWDWASSRHLHKNTPKTKALDKAG